VQRSAESVVQDADARPVSSSCYLRLRGTEELGFVSCALVVLDDLHGEAMARSVQELGDVIAHSMSPIHDDGPGLVVARYGVEKTAEMKIRRLQRDHDASEDSMQLRQADRRDAGRMRACARMP